MSLTTFTALIGAFCFLVMLALFYLTPLRKSRLWTVTVTPLASIIGSGFLIAAPLMVSEYGLLAVPAIALISLFAMAIGYVIRFNILHEDALFNARPRSPLCLIEHVSNIAISLAYVISVAFYTQLLSAFALRMIGVQDGLWTRILSTAILIFIGLVGYLRGLHGLEAMEKVAVNVKMSVIAALLIVLMVFVGFTFRSDPAMFDGIGIPTFTWQSLQTLAGLLLIVQGFEITKFMGHEYDAPTRAKALWIAQLIAAVVYVLFVALAGPLAKGIANIHNETAIIEIVSVAAVGSGFVLSGAAIFSQFGAAVADTIGAGALIETESRARIAERKTYPLLVGLAIVIVWAFNIFAVLTLASRAFALFYFLQALMATIIAWRSVAPTHAPGQLIRRAAFPAIALILFCVVLFAIPSEGEAQETGGYGPEPQAALQRLP